MMKVIRLGKNDQSVINKILTHHIDHTDKRMETPSLSYLEELLNDDRTYLIAAISSDMVTGYGLAYRFSSLYASEYLAYLYYIEVRVENRKQGIGRLGSKGGSMISFSGAYLFGRPIKISLCLRALSR